MVSWPFVVVVLVLFAATFCAKKIFSAAAWMLGGVWNLGLAFCGSAFGVFFVGLVAVDGHAFPPAMVFVSQNWLLVLAGVFIILIVGWLRAMRESELDQRMAWSALHG